MSGDRAVGPDIEVQTRMKLLTPKNLSTYQLLQPLGEGLSSRVVAAVRRDGGGFSEQSVVLKILKSQTGVSWLQKEFDALSAVNSHHCVRVLAWESFDEGPALVLERVDGVTLHDLGRRFQLSEAEIDEIAYQVEQGLRDLHAVSIFHGDLSPKNILISRAGDVKLIDFGAFNANDEVLGTPAYTAHARWSGKNVSSASDFASWALIAHDLRSRFQNVPFDQEKARLRAADFANHVEFLIRCESFATDRASIAQKIEILQQERVPMAGATIALRKNHRTPPVKALAIALLLAISTPVFSNPEPRKPPTGTLRISTMNWVEVTVDHQPSRYAPFEMKLGAGHHRLQWRSQRGSGAFDVSIASAQRETLNDANFRR